jgi:hypothetical protein
MATVLRDTEVDYLNTLFIGEMLGILTEGKVKKMVVKAKVEIDCDYLDFLTSLFAKCHRVLGTMSPCELEEIGLDILRDITDHRELVKSNLIEGTDDV